MKKAAFLIVFAALVISGGLAQGRDKGQELYPAGSRASSYADQKNFTGQVRVDPGFQSQEPARAYGAYVTFEPGSRTNWHVHPLGQTLIVTAGKGLTQEWGKPAVFIKPGDVIVCPPGAKHWHGAAPDTAMTHLAISERAEDMGARWMDKVEDSEYSEAARSAAEAGK